MSEDDEIAELGIIAPKRFCACRCGQTKIELCGEPIYATDDDGGNWGAAAVWTDDLAEEAGYAEQDIASSTMLVGSFGTEPATAALIAYSDHQIAITDGMDNLRLFKTHAESDTVRAYADCCKTLLIAASGANFGTYKVFNRRRMTEADGSPTQYTSSDISWSWWAALCVSMRETFVCGGVPSLRQRFGAPVLKADPLSVKTYVEPRVYWRRNQPHPKLPTPLYWNSKRSARARDRDGPYCNKGIRRAFDKVCGAAGKDHPAVLDEAGVEKVAMMLGAESISSIFSKSILREAMREMDPDRDGKVAFLDFRDWFVATYYHPPEDDREGEFSNKKLREMFDAADKDGGGTLSKDEVGELSSSLGKPLTSFFGGDAGLEEAFDVMDMDGNGSVDFEEFKAWFLARNVQVPHLAAKVGGEQNDLTPKEI
jgi:Ca2+-binding EF-hand superfamily protein